MGGILRRPTPSRVLFTIPLSEVKVPKLCLTLCDPTDYSPPDSSVHGDSPGRNTGVGCCSLLQGIFPAQGSNPDLPHCRQILDHLKHQGSPKTLAKPGSFTPVCFSFCSSLPEMAHPSCGKFLSCSQAPSGSASAMGSPQPAPTLQCSFPSFPPAPTGAFF